MGGVSSQLVLSQGGYALVDMSNNLTKECTQCSTTISAYEEFCLPCKRSLYESQEMEILQKANIKSNIYLKSISLVTTLIVITAFAGIHFKPSNDNSSKYRQEALRPVDHERRSQETPASKISGHEVTISQITLDQVPSFIDRTVIVSGKITEIEKSEKNQWLRFNMINKNGDIKLQLYIRDVENTLPMFRSYLNKDVAVTGLIYVYKGNGMAQIEIKNQSQFSILNNYKAQ